MNEICESDVDIKKDEISVEMAYNNVEESLELFDFHLFSRMSNQIGYFNC